MKSYLFLPFLAYDTFNQQGPFSQEDIPKFINNVFFDQTNNISFSPNQNSEEKDMSDFIESCKNNFSNLLVDEKKILQLVKSHHSQIIEFICQNIEKIVEISLDNQEQNKKDSKTAFSILLSPDRKIHNVLINSDSHILEKMANSSYEKNDNNFSLRRILQLINLTIQVSQYWDQDFPDSLKFIINFVYNIDNPSIYDFFEAICSDNSCYSSVQQWLTNEANLHTIFFDQLIKIKAKMRQMVQNKKGDQKNDEGHDEILNSNEESKNDEIKQDEIKEINKEENEETKKDENEEIKKDENEETKKDENEETKKDENEEIKKDENEETKKDENEETKKDENEEIKKEKNEEIKKDENEEIKKDESEEIKKDENEEIKKDENEEIKKDENEEIKKDENEEIKKDENEEIKKDENEEIKKDENEETKKEENEESYDYYMQKAYSYLNITSICLSSQNLYKNFINATLVDIISDEWKDLNITDPFFDCLWSIASSILSKETTPLMKNLVNRAIQLIKEPFDTVRLCRICSIEMITDIIIIDSSYLELISSSHIEDEIIKLISRFPGHTFLENTLNHFCLRALENHDLQDQYINAVILPLIEMCNNEKDSFLYRIITGFAFPIFQKILQSNQFKNDPEFTAKVKKLEGFDTFENGFYKKRGRLLRIGYGGKTPINRAKSAPSYTAFGF